MMRSVDWTDETGRVWRSLLPDGAVEESAPHYSPIGPVDTTSVGLPEEHAIRLHNELHRRSLWSWREVRHRRQDLEAAVRAALGVTTDSVIALYYTDWQQGVEEKEKAAVPVKPAAAVPRPPSRRRSGSVPPSPSPLSVVSATAPEETP